MTTLVLKRASASRSSGEWNDDDYNVLAAFKMLEKVSSPPTTPMGNQRASGISEREPNNEADCESDFEVRCHVAVTSSRGSSSKVA
jgi:hypothetical protein